MRGIATLFVLCAGCAEAATLPDAGVDAPPLPPDAQVDAPPDATPTSPGFFVDDVAADFAGGTFVGAVLEAFDAIGPAAYYTGGLRVRASDTGVFTDAAATTWAQVEAMTFTAAVAPTTTLAPSWGSGTPAGLGLTSGDDFTLALDGDVYLEAGSWTFHVLADNHAFLELAPAGIPTFSRVLSATWPTEASGVYVAPTTGWYQLRLALAEQTGDAQLRVQVTGPTVPVRANLSRHRTRFAASGLTGLYAAGFDDSLLLGDHQATIDATAPGGAAWNAGAPAGLGITGGDDFSVRWAGQLRLDEDGAYRFRYVSDDGQRLWIDGVPVLDFWDDAAHDETSAPITLDRGWHDVVIDHSESTGAAQAFLGIAAGPELIAATLPVERLRPVVTRGERYDTGVDRADRAIPDLGQVEATITIDAPPGAKVHGLDVGWTFDHPYHPDLQIRLIAPDGSVTLLRDNVAGAGTVTQRLHSGALDQASASGVWRLRVTDTVSLDTGWLRDFQLTVHHRAGHPSIVPAAAYDSVVHDLGDQLTAYQRLSWRPRLAPGTAIRVYARTGDTAQAVAAAPWSAPIVDPDAGAPPVIARRFFQYRIELDSDGDGSALVDWVRLDYATSEVP